MRYKELWPTDEQVYELHPVTEVAMHTSQIAENKSKGSFTPVTLSEYFSEGTFQRNLDKFVYAIRWRDALKPDKRDDERR